MTRDVTWAIDGIVVDGYVGSTPTMSRGETITLEFQFIGEGTYLSYGDDYAAGTYGGSYYGGRAAYDQLRQYLDYAGNQTVQTGLTDRGVPWVRERLPDRATVDSLIVPIEPGQDVLDTDGIWGVIVGGDDPTEPPGNRRLTLEVVVLAELPEYESRQALLDDLGPAVI
ncbi:hypothetical protein [Natrinema thermotolerans]